MNKKNRWTLKEIREAYGQILGAYNEIFPVRAETRKCVEGMESMGDEILKDDGDIKKAFQAQARKTLPKLKEAADSSGNPITWRRGESLDGLSQSLRDRVEKALKLGI